MSTGISIAHSIAEPSARSKNVAAAIIILYAVVSMVPLVWIFSDEPQIAARIQSAIRRR